MAYAPDLSYLSDNARYWLDALLEEWEITDPATLAIAVTAADALTSMDEARRILANADVVLTSQRGGDKLHPAAALLRDSRVALLSAIRALNLEDADDA